MFLDRLRNASPNNACVMESIDVTALYTNVSNESAMQAICEHLTEHERTTNMYGFSIRQALKMANLAETIAMKCVSLFAIIIFAISSDEFTPMKVLVGKAVDLVTEFLNESQIPTDLGEEGSDDVLSRTKMIIAYGVGPAIEK
ncbi:hypothetical protein KIN20_019959, partial [Parelaphostrongylus tenuis]